MDFDAWLDANLKNKKVNSHNIVSWSTTFAFTIWQVALKSINLARWVHSSFNKDIKINIDGCCFYTNSTCGSFGGLARSEQGKWIEGFCGFIGAVTPIQAKLWAISQALRLAKEK